MGTFNSIVQINPLIPATGPLSRRLGASSIIQSIIGAEQKQQVIILAEQVQSLQDQNDAILSLLRLSPTILNLNLPFPIVFDLALVNNSLSAGNISWSPSTVLYNGQFYGIAAGNTAAGEKLVWWVVGSSSYSFGNSFTPNQTTFPIATNTNGVADVTWNKLGANSVQASQVVGNLLPPGYQIQAPATLAGVSGNGGNILLTYTGAGALLTVGVQGNPMNATSVQIQLTVDGSPTQIFQVVTSAAYDIAFRTTCVVNKVDNAAGGSTGFTLGFYISFQASLTVGISISGYTSGAQDFGASWAKKL